MSSSASTSGHILVAQLREQVKRLAGADSPASAVAATRSLEEIVNRYADFHWEHMGREESVVLPAAQRHLTQADWAEINSAFTEDPGIRISGGLDTELHHLLAQIVALNASQARSCPLVSGTSACSAANGFRPSSSRLGAFPRARWNSLPARLPALKLFRTTSDVP